MDEHFEAAAELLSWAHGVSIDHARQFVASETRTLSGEVLSAEIEQSPELWTKWVEEYAASALTVSTAFGEASPAMPTPPDWPALRGILLDEVLPAIRVAIVNSSPEADDRPDFEIQQGSQGFLAPTNMMTIFVSGNVMARGLTLEGLTTTLFLRGAEDPTADTQMQMQRWFGYRGAILDLCRVFISDSQLSLFSQYHELDEGLRSQVLAAMNASSEAPSPLVLEGAHFRATAKIVGVNSFPLSPGAAPFVPLTPGPAGADPNLDLLVDLFQTPNCEVEAGGLVRGRILELPRALAETATILDGLRYQDYAPAADEPAVRRWSALEKQIGLADERSPLRPLYRGPTGDDAGRDISPRRCPYQIAAYMRLWAACLERTPRGLFATDNAQVPWRSVDLEERARTQPRFWIGLRFGGQGVAASRAKPDLLSALPFSVEAVRRAWADGLLTSTWGSRNPSEDAGGYRGDQFMDYHHHKAFGPHWQRQRGSCLETRGLRRPAAAARRPERTGGRALPGRRAQHASRRPGPLRRADPKECGMTGVSYEGVKARLDDLRAAPGSSEREITWLDEPANTVGLARNEQQRVEVFLAGPELTCRSPLVAAAIETRLWQRSEDGTSVKASRLVLPSEKHFDAVAAFVCTHLLDCGFADDRQAAFTLAEPVMEPPWKPISCRARGS